MPILNTFTDWRDEVFDEVENVTKEVFGGPVKDFLDDFVGIDDDGGIVGSTSRVLADINDGVNEVLQDDNFVMVATVALAAVPGGSAFIPVLQGAATGARGGDFEDIVGSMAKSYLASEVGAYAGEAASQAAIDAGYGTTIANVLGSGSTSAGVALVYGDDPVQAFLTGGASAGVGGALDAMFGNAEGVFGDIAKGKTDTDKVIREVLVANGTAALTGEDANVATVRALANSLPIVSDFVKTASETNNLNETETRLLTNIVQSSIIGTFTDKSINEELMGRLTTEGNKALNEAIGTGVRDSIDKVSGNYAKVADVVSQLEEKQAEIQALRDQPKYENLSSAEWTLKPAVHWQRRYKGYDVRTNGQYWYLRKIDDLNDFVDKMQSGKYSNYQPDSKFLVHADVAERIGFKLKPSDKDDKGLHFVDAKRYLEYLKLDIEKQAEKVNSAADIVKQFNEEARPLYDEMQSLSVTYKDAHKELVQDTDKLDEELIFIQDNFQKAVVKGIDPDFDEELYREEHMDNRSKYLYGKQERYRLAQQSAFEHFLETGFSEGAPSNEKSIDLKNKVFNDTLTSLANDYALSIGADSFLDLSPETLSFIAREVDYKFGRDNADQLQELTLGDIRTGSGRVWQYGRYEQMPPIEEQTQNPIRNSVEFDGLSDSEIVDFLSGNLELTLDKNGVVAVDTNRTDTDEYYSNKYGADVIKKITKEEVQTEDGFEYVTKTVITDKNTGAVLDTSEQKDQSFAIEILYDVAPELAVEAVNNFSQEAIDMSANYFIKALKAELEESGESRVLEVVARGGGQALKAIGYVHALKEGFVEGGIDGAIHAVDRPETMSKLYALADAMEMAGEAATPEDAKAIEQKMSDAIGEAEGLGKVKAFFGNFVDHPTEALIKYVGVEAAGELLPLMVGGAASLTVKLGGKVLTKTMAKDLAKETIEDVARKAGYTTAISSDMLESFGANAEDTYNEAYKAAIKSGMSEEQAKETAYTKSLSVGVMAAVTTGTLSKFGGGALEKEIFSPKAGINGKELFNAFSDRVAKGAKISGKEAGAEALDEGIINAYKEMELYELDPNRDITGNIALAATMGAVVGGTISGSVYTGMQTGDLATDILIAGNDKVKKAIRGIGADGSGASNAVEVLQQYGINDPNIVGRALSTQMADPDQVRLTLGEYYQPDGEIRAVPYSLDMEQKSDALEQIVTEYNQNLGYAKQNRNNAEQEQIKNEQALAYFNGERPNKPGFAYTPYSGSNRLNFSYYTKPGKRFQNRDGAREEDYQGYVDTLSNALGNNDSIEIEFPRFGPTTNPELRKAFDAMLGMPYQYGFKSTGDVYGGTFTRDMMDKVREDLESMRRVHEKDLQRIQDRVDNPTDVSGFIKGAKTQEETAEQKLQQFMEITEISNREDAIESAQSPDFSVESLYGSAVQPVESSVYTSEQELPDPEIFIPTEDVDPVEEIVVPTEDVDPVEEIIVPTEDVEPTEEISVPTDDIITGPDVVVPTTPDQVLDDIIESNEEILVPTEDEVVVPEGEITVPTQEEVVPEEEVIVPVEEDYEVPQEVIDLVTESRDETVDLVSDLEESIIGDINALTDSGLSRDEAIAKLADDLGSTEQSIRDVIEASEQATSDLIDSLSEGIDADIGAVNQSIDDLVETGLSRDEAISQIASDLGETEESLRQAIDSSQEQTSELISDLEENVGQDIADAIAASEETTGDLISELSESIGGEIDTIADSITALEESGSTRDEAIATVSETLGTTEENLKNAISDVESGLATSIEEAIAASESTTSELISDLAESVGQEITTVSDAISALEQAGETRDSAIAQVADSIGTTEDNLRKAIEDVESGVATSIAEAIGASEKEIADAISDAVSTSEEATGDLISALEDSLTENITGVAEDVSTVSEAISALEEAGNTRDESIATIAESIGTTEDTLKKAIDDVESGVATSIAEAIGASQEEVQNAVADAIAASEEATGDLISDLEESLGADISGVAESVAALEEVGSTRDEAIAQIAEDLGTTSEELAEALAASEEATGELISGLEESLGEDISAVEESLGEDISGLEESLGGEINTISEAISALQEAGKTSDEAIAEVAENLGTTEENLKDAIASVESGVATSIEEAISASEEGITKAIESAISASEETTGKLIDDLGTALEGSISDAISNSETATGELISALEESVGTDIKSITDTIDGLTQSGSDRDEAIAAVAENLGTTEEALIEAISASEEATKGVISDLEGAIGDNIDGIEDQIQSLEDQGIVRDEAIQAVADSIISEETLQGLIAESVSELDLTSEIEDELEALSDAIAELQKEFEMPEGSLDVEQGTPGEFYFGQVESLEPIINTQTGEATGDQMVTVRVGDELLDPVPVSSLADSNLRIIGNDVVRADYKPVAVETSERDLGPVLTDPVYDYSDLPGFENVPTDLPDLTPEQDSELNRIVARSATDNLLRAQDVEEARRAGIDPNTLRTAFSNYRIGAFTEEPEEPDDLSDIMLGIPDYDMDPFGIEFGDIDFSIPERQRPRFYSPPIMPPVIPPRRTPVPFDFGDRGVFNFPGAPEYGAPPTKGTDFYRDFGQFISSEGMARELQRPLIDPETGALIPSQYAPAYMGPSSLIEETGEGMYIDPVLAGLEPE